MPRPDSWSAYFTVRGTFDPDAITEKLGIVPSGTAKEGAPLSRGTLRRKCSSWELRSRTEETAPLEEQVKDVLDQRDANKSGFVQLSREHGGTMQLVGYFSETEPRVHFDQATVERIAGYSLSIDCDFYNRR